MHYKYTRSSCIGNGQVSVYDVGDLQEPTRLFTQKLIAGTVGDLEVST